MNKQIVDDLERHLSVALANVRGLRHPNREYPPSEAEKMALRASLREQLSKVQSVGDLIRQSPGILT